MKRISSSGGYMPRATTKEIVVQEVGGETLIYDMRVNKAHNLNSTMAMILKYCDGKTRIQEVAASLEEKLKTKIEDDFIYLAILELERANLLLEGDSLPEFQDISRRKVLFNYALPALAMPIVLSLVAPESVHAQSCAMLQDPCAGAGTGNCCPGIDACQSFVCCNGVGSPCSVEADCCGVFSCDTGNGICI